MVDALEVKGYKIPKVNMNFEKIANGQQRIEMGTSIKIMIPKEATDKTSVVAIKAEFKNENQNLILSVEIKGFVEFSDTSISTERKEDLIKYNAVQIVYEKLREFIGQLLENACIDFVNLPPYEELGA